MEGKWFATTAEHTEQWVSVPHQGNGLTVKTQVPESVADQLYLHEGKLDGVGPVLYSDGEQLDLINRLMNRIRVWP
jgi:hypothetical protein